ncbi:MAG: ATP synthase complex subunit H-domain-containing protein [Piptocephalis tieghemiana]|nr:MAG: ATP synthase complex subunit H-domain-containing protein [Piptocephalis tieghemiana]
MALATGLLQRSAYKSTTQTRTFMAPSLIRSKDIVQDLYLKELKGYKPSPEIAKMEQGQVKEFVPPAKPTAPTVDASSVSADLAAYDVEEDVTASQDEGLALPDEDFESEEAEEASAH